MPLCDNLPCMNKIDEDEYQAAHKKMQESHGGGLVFCGHCEDSPPTPDWLKEVIENSFEENLDLLRKLVE